MDREWLETQFKIHRDKSKADLARALGLEPPAVSKILSGGRQIKAQEYVTMRLFFGMPAEGERAVMPGAGRSYVLDTLDFAMNEKETPETESGDSWVIPAHLFEGRTKSPPEKIKIFAVQEDAMIPEIYQGEQVLVDLSDKKPSPAGVFVVSDGLGYIIRQCEYVPHSDPPEIKLSARNSKYDSYVTLLEKAEIIGRAIAKLQWL